jgi:hypothetical protein
MVMMDPTGGKDPFGVSFSNLWLKYALLPKAGKNQSSQPILIVQDSSDCSSCRPYWRPPSYSKYSKYNRFQISVPHEVVNVIRSLIMQRAVLVDLLVVNNAAIQKIIVDKTPYS